jgi:hypothetical protein
LLARVSKDGGMTRAYWRTAQRCGNVIDQDGGTLRQYWCGARWCPQCNAIRTARAWSAYGPEVDGWAPADRYLVTLTVPNVDPDELRETVRAMHAAFAGITKALKWAHGAVRMIRATECTYSEKQAADGRPAFHPHIHCLVHGAAVAHDLKRRWLKRWPQATDAAQDVRLADRGATAELFKYAAKLASDKRDPDGGRRLTPPWALDVMFTALRGLRLWQAVGIRSATADADAADDTAALRHDHATLAVSRPTENVVWHWCPPLADWIDLSTGEVLADYMPGRSAAAFFALLDAMLTAPDGMPADPIRGALPRGPDADRPPPTAAAA